MRSLTLFMCCIFAASTLHAQSSFYLKADGGWGGTWSTNVSPIDRGTSDVARAFHAALNGGWQAGNWSGEVGVGLSRTGSAYEHALVFTYQIDNNGNLVSGEPVPVTYTLLHKHVTLPVSVGYSLPVTDRLALQVRLGVIGAYNTGALTRIEYETRTVTDQENGPLYDRSFQRYSLFSSTAFQIHWQAAPQVAFFGGAQYRHMLSNLIRVPPMVIGDFSLRTISASVDAGVIFFFRERKGYLGTGAEGAGING